MIDTKIGKKRGSRGPPSAIGTAAPEVRMQGIGLDKGVGTTQIISQAASTTISASGKPVDREPGFFCDVCNRVFKDSLAYLDHINSPQRINNFNLPEVG